MENETAKCTFAMCYSDQYNTSSRSSRNELTQFSFMDDGNVKVHVTNTKYTECVNAEDEITTHAYCISPENWWVEKTGKAMFFVYKHDSIGRKPVRISREAFTMLLAMENQA